MRGGGGGGGGGLMITNKIVSCGIRTGCTLFTQPACPNTVSTKIRSKHTPSGTILVSSDS